MELYNAIKADVFVLLDKIGIPVVALCGGILYWHLQSSNIHVFKSRASIKKRFNKF